MTVVRFLPVALLAVAGTALATDHTGGAPATHMQLKDGSGSVVCAAYNTSPESAPIATDCLDGPFTEQLFDSSWNQVGERSVVVGGGVPVAGVPVRVERTCEFDAETIREFARDATQGDNVNPFCAVTCPEGVAIDGEATASIPALSGGDDAIFEGVSYTQGTGQQTINIYMDSSIPLDVVLDRYTDSFGDLLFDGSANLMYEIKAAATCL